MKKITLILFLILFGTASAGAQRTTITALKTKNIFKTLSISGSFDVKLSQGFPNTVRFEVEPELADKLIVGDTLGYSLYVRYNSDMAEYFALNRPVVYVTLSVLSELSLRGDCRVSCQGQFETVTFGLEVYGTSFCEGLNVRSYGGSMISLEDEAKVEGLQLICPDDLKVSISGTSKLSFSGSAPQAQFLLVGSSNCDALGFSCPDLQISATGSSLLNVNVSGKADITTSDLGSVRYRGSGQVTSNGFGVKQL